MNAKRVCPECGSLFLKSLRCPLCEVDTMEIERKSVEDRKLDLQKNE